MSALFPPAVAAILDGMINEKSPIEAARWLLKEGSGEATRPLRHYVLFLKEMQNVFEGIERLFPLPTPHVHDPGRIDSRARLSDGAEMLTIAAYIYTLSSHNIPGDVAEFGCFCGFSTACLSHACAALGCRLHVFDSFKGLPSPDAPGYAAGDFTAPLSLTRRNVETFGRPDTVIFHPGWFHETVPDFHVPLKTLWIDVDLAVSARPVTRLLATLPRCAAVLSHECAPEYFAGPDPRPPPGGVISEIHTTFTAAGRPATGQHLSGDLGAIWENRRGIPVAGTETLQALAALAN